MLKTSRLAVLSISVLSLLFLMSSAMAHAPLGSGDNESIDKATVIPDPTKSWAIYAELHSDGDAQYYTFNITTGQKIHVMLFKSMRSEESDFTPRLVVIGPNITAQGTIPSYVNVTIPSGAQARVVESKEPTATYEPFSPSSFISLSDEAIDSPVEGTYYVVVYEQSSTPTGGHYGLAIGDRETYGLDEWVLIPLHLLSIYQWAGQSLAMILAPMVSVIVIGTCLILWRMRNMGRRGTIAGLLGVFAGLLFVGTGATTLFEMALSLVGVPVGAEVGVTLVFALIPVLLGFAALRLSLRKEEKTTIRKRVYMVVLGIAALFAWAGLLIGPALAITAGLVPHRGKKEG